MTAYINQRYQGVVETVDEFDTHKEARETIKEYRASIGHGIEYWISNRACKQWHEDSKPKAEA